MADTTGLPGGTREVPDRTRMPLLTLITQQSLDEDYQVAAERRAAGAPLAPRGRPQRTAAVVVAVFGVLVATAFVQTSRNADVDTASRESLIRRIDDQSARRARQEERVALLRTRVAALDRSVSQLIDDEAAAAVSNRRLEVRTGFIAVRGEGIRVTVTEPENADENQQVQDRDLRLLVNGLFEAGAEAVSVNGRRLTAVSAIRSSGAAIGVNGSGIAPPYVVEAIGDQRTLAARLFDTTTGLQFVSTARVYGFEYDVQNGADLTLPAASEQLRRLRSAEVSSSDQTTSDQTTSDQTTSDQTTSRKGAGP